MFPVLYAWLPTPVTFVMLATLALCAAVVLNFLFHQLYFSILPLRAVKKYKKSDPERLRRYLERVAATPSFLGPASKLVVRGALVGIYLPQGKHAEAAAHCRAILATLTEARRRFGGRADFPALEADTRRRLADCLDALGQVEEAQEERRRAEAGIDRAPDDSLRYLTQGTLLERQHKYAEACTAFEQALSLTSESDRKARIECMTHLVLATYNSGRPVDCLRWAEEAIASGAEGLHLRGAHKMAGVACGNLGRLEESEDHYRRAYDVAAAEGDAGEMGQILGSLAGVQAKRGNLAEANEACTKAAAVDPKGIRMAIAIQSQILRGWGRFDEALELLGRHDDGPKLNIPAHERRIQAVRALDLSRIEAECGRVDDALAHIQQAIEVLGNDAKLGLYCEGALAWVHAARGLADESRRVAAQAEARLAEYDGDPSTCRGVYYDLGMAACKRGDYENGENCWDQYLELFPDPVHQPTALYFRGECRLHLGEKSAAIADFRAAVAMNIDTHYAGLARKRLADALA